MKTQIRLNFYLILLLDVSVYTDCLLVNVIILDDTSPTEELLMKFIAEIKLWCNINLGIQQNIM